MKIEFIGGGAMGEALIKSLLAKNDVKPDDIVVHDISAQRRDYMATTYRVKVQEGSKSVLPETDVIVLAVKPQDFHSLKNMFTGLSDRQMIISIMAGVTLENIQTTTRHTHVVRSMPNMPAQIGEGMTVWTALPEVTETQKKQAKLILSSCGEELYVNDEKYMDMATAVSGSGPAYMYMIIEALSDAGVHIGMPRKMAEKLVIETMIGSARSLKQLGKHPAELKNMVTSPGGTSSEGLLQLEVGGLRSLMLRAVIAAYEKSKAMGTKK
jgi:pyrroline-5-carboxylate reductase